MCSLSSLPLVILFVVLFGGLAQQLYYCNIIFPYRIRKIVRNVPINILGHEGKKL